jgi:membrane-bound serine protease (ClpP class)
VAAIALGALVIPSSRQGARSGTRSSRARVATVLLLVALATGSSPWFVRADSGQPVVYVVPITGVVDLGLAPFVERILDEAAVANAAAVIFQLDTFGGRVDGAVLIRDDLLRARVRTVAFVDQRAISAGALITLAAETIAMARGATVGAATPVQMGQQGDAAAPVAEKTLSYMRKEFRATAESRGRPPLLAEAMVDPDVEIPGVIEKGKLLTLTTEEALKLGFADFRADSLDAVLAKLELAGAEVRRPSQTWAETLVRFLTDPLVSSLLMTIGILGIIVEIRTPGFGVPGALGLTSLALFFWGHWLVRLAGWEELLLVGSGVALLVVEVFVIPGFGILGALGIAALLGGLGLSMVGAGASGQMMLQSLGLVAMSLVLAIAVSLALMRILPRLPLGRRLVLETELPPGAGDAAPEEIARRWIGRRGTAASPLRPAGIAHIDDERVDVVSQGEFIEPGEPIEVIEEDGNRIVVRRRHDGASQGGKDGA